MESNNFQSFYNDMPPKFNLKREKGNINSQAYRFN